MARRQGMIGKKGFEKKLKTKIGPNKTNNSRQ